MSLILTSATTTTPEPFTKKPGDIPANCEAVDNICNLQVKYKGGYLKVQTCVLRPDPNDVFYPPLTGQHEKNAFERITTITKLESDVRTSKPKKPLEDCFATDPRNGYIFRIDVQSEHINFMNAIFANLAHAAWYSDTP